MSISTDQSDGAEAHAPSDAKDALDLSAIAHDRRAGGRGIRREAGRLARRLANGLLDSMLPPRCLACGEIVEQPHTLCPVCWPQLTFLAEPLCCICGQPFAAVAYAGTTCAACAYPERAVARVRAALAYDDGSRGLILAFKHADRTDAATAFARWMQRAGASLLADADLLVPVPLHWTRLSPRRYNQAALLALAIGRLAERPVAPDLLHRRKRTTPLGDLGPAERAATVRAAFKVGPRARSRIAGSRVLLVDDVFTTGATTESCALTLLRAGAASVDVLALARVVRPVALPGTAYRQPPVRH